MSVLHIYMTNASDMGIGKPLAQLLEGLPRSMHQRALRYLRQGDAHSFIAGRLLLQKALKELGIADSIENIQINKNGKPFLESVSFNISHSADLVVCAVSEQGDIGIDIEKEKEVELSNFEAWFTPAEWKAIHESRLPLQQFYRYWTRKESIIKALGLTLAHLNQIQLDLEQALFEDGARQWYLQDLNVGKGYWGAVCSEIKPDFPASTTYLDL